MTGEQYFSEDEELSRVDFQHTFLEELKDSDPTLNPLEASFIYALPGDTLSLEIKIPTVDEEGHPIKQILTFDNPESFEEFMCERYKNDPLFCYIQDVGSTELACQLCLASGVKFNGVAQRMPQIADFFKQSTTRYNYDSTQTKNVSYDINAFFHAIVSLNEDLLTIIRDDFGIQEMLRRFDPQNIRQREQTYQRRVTSIVERYKDRQFILEREEKVLRLVEEVYPDHPELSTAVMRFYRIGDYRNSFSYFRTGNYKYLGSNRITTDERDQVNEYVQVAQAIAEWIEFKDERLPQIIADQRAQGVEDQEINGINYYIESAFGKRMWVKSNGERVSGYWREKLPHFFPERLKEYEENLLIIQKLGETNSLNYLQQRYLLFVTNLRLSKRMNYNKATALFNRPYSVHGMPGVSVNERLALVRQLLEKPEAPTYKVAKTTRRMVDINYVLENRMLMSTVWANLQQLLLNYHIGDYPLGLDDEISDLELDGVSGYTAFNVRKLLHRVLFDIEGEVSRSHLNHNAIVAAIDNPENRAKIIDIIRQSSLDAMAVARNSEKIVGRELSYRQILALRILMERISQEYDAVTRIRALDEQYYREETQDEF